jgi:hypothetical protein
MVTGAEVDAVAKAGATIVQGLQKANADTKWPQIHEALMELFAIIDEWCEAALNSNKLAERLADDRLNGVDSDAEHDLRQFSNIGFVEVGPFTIRDYIARTTKDIEGVLSPAPPWVQRWRASKRRAAGRRTLEKVLRIYEPGLLDSFEKAVADRANWVKSHRAHFDEIFAHSRPTEELLEELQEMENTLDSLVDVRQRLLALIRERYPLGPPIESVR